VAGPVPTFGEGDFTDEPAALPAGDKAAHHVKIVFPPRGAHPHG